MYSKIIAGLLAIYYASVQLGANWTLKLFWIGLIIWGVVTLVEGAPRVRSVLDRRPTA